LNHVNLADYAYLQIELLMAVISVTAETNAEALPCEWPETGSCFESPIILNEYLKNQTHDIQFKVIVSKKSHNSIIRTRTQKKPHISLQVVSRLGQVFAYTCTYTAS